MANLKNVPTPWGKSQGGELLAPGIKQYHTASHGGIKLLKKLNNQIPLCFRRHDGWYEEDCDAIIVWYYHYDAIEAHMRASGMPGYRLSADAYFTQFPRSYFKKQLEQWFIPESIHYFGTVRIAASSIRVAISLSVPVLMGCAVSETGVPMAT